MRVTSLEPGFRKQVRVFLEEEFAFSRFENEVTRFDLKVNTDLSEELYHEIDAVVFLRGKKKALDYLKRMDYTEYELKNKLVQYGFHGQMAERILEYVHSYHYLDDERYAKNYISYKKSQKSIRQLRLELSMKGIEKEQINLLLEEEKVSDNEAIQKAISKKTKNLEGLDNKEKQKLAAYLFRKGFLESDIRSQIKF